MGRMTLITGVKRRRRWSDEDRVRILAAIAEPGAVVADIARREDVCTSLVYRWRRAARRDRSAHACGFAPVIIETAPAAPSTLRPANVSDAGVIEVDIKDVRVRIRADAPSGVITATLKALRS
ncbi:IS66-like element accessory protein TnpA [Methylocapsa palsarum]|uniref:IS66-like element accessory protein TnpA n=1 Tax=Methylocapsa palsarum TaxID=1612308 RepID=UPI000AA3DF15